MCADTASARSVLGKHSEGLACKSASAQCWGRAGITDSQLMRSACDMAKVGKALREKS